MKPFYADSFREIFLWLIHKLFKVIQRQGVSGLLLFLRYAPEIYSHKKKQALFYQDWVRDYDTIRAENRLRFHQTADQFKAKPLISIVMPVFNPPLDLLEKAINSVRNQIYPRWELCIADDASTDPAVRQILERHENEDSRIRVVYRQTNGHISEASNSALKIARGEFVALLDHDDLLSEHALFWIVNEINTCPDAQILYSDEDKIDDRGRRYDPYFKCDWNRDLFLSQNMITHLGVYRKNLMDRIGGFRKGLEGAQDYDLALRCMERLDADQIRHIPKILYHWRSMKGSTALSSDQKPYAAVAGMQAIGDYLKRNRISATAQLVEYGYRVKYKLPRPLPRVSLIIRTHSPANKLLPCINSIYSKTDYPNYDVTIINGCSSGLKECFTDSEHRSLRVFPRGNLANQSAAINQAVREAEGSIIGLLTDRIKVIHPDWMHELVSHAIRPEVGAAGAQLLYQNGRLKHAGLILNPVNIADHAHEKLPRLYPGFFGRATLIQSFSAVSGSCLFVRKSIYQEAGGMNEDALALYYNDVDLCLKLLEKGYRNIYTPYAQLYFVEPSATQTAGSSVQRQKALQYMRCRWQGYLLNDPSYNPNLAYDSNDFSYAFPPRTAHVL